VQMAQILPAETAQIVWVALMAYHSGCQTYNNRLERDAAKPSRAPHP